MKDTVQRGLNKTGIANSLEFAKEMIAGTIEFPPMPVDTSQDIVAIRQTYIKASGQLGSIPSLNDETREVLIDKLSERLAFERGGIRLYQAFLAKCEALSPNFSLGTLKQFLDEEIQHFRWVHECIENLGGDPTCQTPCADVTGITNMGLVQVVTDPRTTIAQAAHALLLAELADNVGWDLLIQLVEKAGLQEDLDHFQQAKDQEDNHLIQVRHWHDDMILKNQTTELH